ncbi:hypothetical protein GJW-30_1_02409 [Variibacter gotjawalensis]|uniref:DUF1795 domain-containing protein n=1 Tax=Variibacter gotjawalensis TaxID=1333996 RepID=A0A0S3PVE8_9BRAD|nr:hypothetical protein [Variibacter gotjawalensis]NIK45695.1 hypothetical protein [Variibacter gotjawalensis]RZS47622.1 hypothetical protein EV661_0012 [Variibacter gotjawalensis]BAT59874.1 hypothetical protein GJW-30_1_02409 [Variibacter gotjawalensis]
MTLLRRIAACALVFVIAIAPLSSRAFAQQRITIPGTTVTLAAPPSFKLSDQFSGLYDEARKASVLIVEFPPVAYDQISTLFKDLETVKANFARQQVAIESLETIDTPAGKVPFAGGTQAVGGMTFDKWVALYKGEKTVLMTVQAPQSEKLGADNVKAMLQSVALGAAPKISEKIATLPFAINIAEPYRAVDTIGGLGLLLTVGPLDTDPNDTQPNVIVVYQASAPIDFGNLDNASEQLLKHTRGYQAAQITSKSEMPFAGVRGYVVRGTNTNAGGAQRHFVHYLGVSPTNSYIRLVAAGDEKQMNELKPALEKIVASTKLKDAK